MPIDVESYLAKFRAFGSAPSVERYLALFHPDGTVYDAGMEAPLGLAEIPAHIETILKAVPDFRFEIGRWRARDDTVFVEAHNRATLGGAPLAWDSVYCMTLEGDQVSRGRRYYDRLPLLARLNPNLPPLPAYTPVNDDTLEPPRGFPSVDEFVDAYVKNWQDPEPRRFADFYAEDGVILNPGMDEPIPRPAIPGYYVFLLAVSPDFRQNLVSWAGDEELVFIEWKGVGTVADRPLTMPVVDRWNLRDGLATEGVAYFDTSLLLAALAGAAGGGEGG